MKFGTDGDLYVLEYGSNWFRKSDNAEMMLAIKINFRIIRIIIIKADREKSIFLLKGSFY